MISGWRDPGKLAPGNMDSDRFNRLEEIFSQALEVPPGPDREQFLALRCGSDSGLLACVRNLIHADRDCATAGPADEELPSEEFPSFGVFQAEAILGRGGAGVVYLARRTDAQFDQLAAVKVIQSEFAGASVREGFLGERRILAALHHPGIAQMLDGGFRADGTPYLVMEYIAGERLDHYCQNHRLSIPDRLTLFCAVCDAVSYAHRNLVVHLDLKPSNILVTADGHAKLLDFGTARILAGADSTVTQILATPRYASPEQMRGEHAGLLSDIYSLGVVLAELCTGQWPFGNPDSRADALRRAVDEVELMPLSSTTSREHAESCGISLKQLRNELSGDLGAILWKALQKDPEQRYHSVDDFATDLKRYTKGLPVTARGQTRRYRAAKFVSRNRVPVAISAIAIVAITVLCGYAWREQQHSLEEGRRAKVLNTYLMRVFQSANPQYDGRVDMTIGELAERAISQAGSMLQGQTAAQAELGMELGAHQIYTRGTAGALATLDAADEAARQSGDPGLRVATLAYRSALQRRLGHCQEAMSEIKEARRIADANPSRVPRERRTTFLINEANVIADCGAGREAALRSAREAIQLARTIPDNSVEWSSPPAVMKIYSLLAAAKLERCGDRAKDLQEALAIIHKNGGMQFGESMVVELQAWCMIEEGRHSPAADSFARAYELRRVALGAGFPATQLVRAERAWALALAGKPEAVDEANAAMRGGHCELAPLVCDQTQVLGAQVLVNFDRAVDAMPVIQSLLARPATAIAARTCLYVIYMDRRQPHLAQPNRESARKWIANVPLGTPWRRKIEAALAAGSDL
jgi:hypothetical protein